MTNFIVDKNGIVVDVKHTRSLIAADEAMLDQHYEHMGDEDDGFHPSPMLISACASLEDRVESNSNLIGEPSWPTAYSSLMK